MTQSQIRTGPCTRPSISRRERRRTARAGATLRSLAPVRRPVDRRSALARVLALWPNELDDASVQGRRNLIAKLRRALRAERRRGIAGHWTYDLARHVELLHVYRRELMMLKAIEAGAERRNGPRSLPAIPERSG